MQKILYNKIYLTIALIILWQLISIGLLATGVWPFLVVWINLAIIAAAIVVLPKADALGLFLLSLPFMVVIPEGIVPNMPMWRPLSAWLISVVAVKYLISVWRKDVSIFANIKQQALDFYQNKLNKWDLWLVALIGIAAASLLVADFAAHGLKQILYLLNVYCIYLAALLAVADNDDWAKTVRYFKYSLLLTVLLGFVQFFATFFTQPYIFWQYWATLVSSAYYGQPLGQVLAYSNSWFSAEGGNSSLRMFGILQDTHAFAVIAIFALAMWWAKAKVVVTNTRVRHIFRDQSRWYWLVLTMLCFAIIASGTRGVWVAMMIPILAVVVMIYKLKARLLGALPWLSFTIIILLFLFSPWITTGFNWLRSVSLEDNILKRAVSVYDLREDSNVGRLEIWKDSFNYSLRHPLGTGYGNFITTLVDAPEGSTFEEVSADKNLRYNLPQKFITAHSLYLHILVELGLAGLIIFVLFWWTVAKQLWLALSESQFMFTMLNMFFMAVGIALLWLLAYGLFDVTIFNERVLLYLMSLLALLNIALRNKPQTLF